MKLAVDVAIIGAGPAGASCALWLKHLGFDPLLIEASNTVGGLSAKNPFDDIWNVSTPVLSGEQVAVQISKNLEQASIAVYLNHKLININRCQNQYFSIYTINDQLIQNQFTARFVVIATGVSPKGLSYLPTDAPLNPQKIFVGPGQHMRALDVTRRKVAVLGGGDNAFENAIMFSQNGASQVDIYARSVKAQKKWSTFLTGINLHHGDYMIDVNNMTINQQAYDYFTVFYGWQARLDGLDSLGLQLDAKGYIATDWQTAQTSMKGVYAIGEVANRQHPCVVTAMADGVVAAKAIQMAFE